MLAGLADIFERFCYFLITFVTWNSIQNNQFPANIWVPLCCHPLIWGWEDVFKEQVTSFTGNNKFNGNLKITIGKNNYDLNVPFQTLHTGSEGEIRNVWDLMEDYYSDTKGNSKVKNFLSNMSVFTRWYSYETKTMTDSAIIKIVCDFG